MADTSSAPESFRTGLADLKREGCAVLVVGRVPEHLLDDLSARLLGDACADRDRLRVLGLVDRTVDRARTRLSLADGATAARVVTTAAGRTTAAMEGGPDPTEASDAGRPTPDVERVASVERFVEALPAAVADAAAARDPLDPAELRVCVDSLRPLVAASVDHRAFVERVREECKRRRAMAHFVLRAPADGETATTLASLFDVVVSLRSRDGPEQRWHLRSPDHCTGWVRYPDQW